MESRLYACPRCGKSVKSINGLTKHVNACKILVTLPSCQTFILAPILKYKMTNHPDLLSDYFEEDISPEASNNHEEEIRLADIIGNDDKNSRPMDIDKQRPTTPNWIPRNGLLSELSQNFREVIFSEFKFLVSTSVSDTSYVHLES